jgi:hypothetical protein
MGKAYDEAAATIRSGLTFQGAFRLKSVHQRRGLRASVLAHGSVF